MSVLQIFLTIHLSVIKPESLKITPMYFYEGVL
jgi:hypothetical protein